MIRIIFLFSLRIIKIRQGDNVYNGNGIRKKSNTVKIIQCYVCLYVTLSDTPTLAQLFDYVDSFIFSHTLLLDCCILSSYFVLTKSDWSPLSFLLTSRIHQTAELKLVVEILSHLIFSKFSIKQLFLQYLIIRRQTKIYFVLYFLIGGIKNYLYFLCFMIPDSFHFIVNLLFQ